MPIILYGSALSPPCKAVMLTAKVLGVDVELKDMDILVQREQKTDSFLEKLITGCHTVIIMDDDGYYLWESHAIMGYLAKTHDKTCKLYFEDPKISSMMDNLSHMDATDKTDYSTYEEYLTSSKVSADKQGDLERKAIVEGRLAILDKWLAEHPYMAGDKVTISDISIVTSLSIPKAAGFSFDNYPNIMKWFNKLEEEISLLSEVIIPLLTN